MCAVEARITDAGKAFSALRKCLFASTTVTRAAKTAVYEAFILSIVTEAMLHRLRVFHAQ